MSEQPDQENPTGSEPAEFTAEEQSGLNDPVETKEEISTSPESVEIGTEGAADAGIAKIGEQTSKPESKTTGLDSNTPDPDTLITEEPLSAPSEPTEENFLPVAESGEVDEEAPSSAEDEQPGPIETQPQDSLADVRGNIRQNWRILLQASTWQEISKEVPMRAKASLVLILVLVSAVIWVQSSLLPAPKAVVQLVKTGRSAQAPATLTPHLRPQDTPTPAPLGSSNVSTLENALRNQPQATPTPLFKFHEVQAEETLISIAAQYNVTTESLLVANNIRDPEAIEVGQYILIPPEDARQQQKIMVHEVKEGDTLLTIASKYGSSVKDIQAANPHLGDDTPPEGDAVAVPIVFVTDNPLLEPQDSEETIYHIVQPGEMPLSIAAQYNIPVDILLAANDITDPTLLQIGQQIIIPPHDGITLSFPVILYELQESDTLVGIASRFGSSVKDILAVNPELDPANLEVGQLVAIPVIFAPPRPTPGPSDAPRPTPGPPPPALTDLNQQLVQVINARREANGLPPYTFDSQLAQAALHHAQDMIVRDFFAHVNPDGMSLGNRLTADGISYLSAGENIQRNTQPRASTVEAAINWFMNSTPHRANILHQDHNRIGVTIVESPPGWYTFVLVFAHR